MTVADEALANRTLAAHQPNYVPWLGYLHKAEQADVFVLADDVQYTKHGYVNRNRVRTGEGWQWLTVPVRSRGRAGQLIRDTELETDLPWARKHVQTFEWNYRDAPFFEEHMPFLRDVFASQPTHLLELNLQLLKYLLDQLEIDTELRMSSELPKRTERSQRLADMAVACDCTTYLAGDGGSQQYLDEAVLQAAGVEVRFTTFQHPVYAQCFPGFEAGMCAFDLLFNCGPRSREVLFA
jgi:hypothetical protein